MDTNEYRNNILMDLIDKMHSQMADKAYPDEKPKIPGELPSEDEAANPENLPEGETGAVGDQPRDEDDEDLLDQLMKQREAE